MRAWRPGVWLLTFCTGGAGLIYQIAWQRYLTRLVGSDSLAVATVLGVFLGGLALGYLACGRLTLHVKNVLRTYAVLEAVIGLWGLAFPSLFRAVDAATASWSFAPPWHLALQGALCGAVLIGPPTLCMGGTVPLLTRALAGSLQQATRVHARVYAVNTAGAFLGAVAAGFALILLLGLPATLRVAAAINLTAAAFFALGASRLGAAAEDAAAPPRTERAPAASSSSDARARPAAWTLHSIAFFGGVYCMTLESLLVRITNLSMGSSAYGFALIVGVFVLAIALGSAAVARRGPGSPAALAVNQLGVALCLMALFLTLDKWPWAAHVLRIGFSGTPSAFVLYHWTAFVVLLGLLVVPVGLMGATLPLAFHALKRDLVRIGASAGTLFAWNAAGNLIGGLVGGFLVYNWLGQGEVFLAALGLAVGTMGLATVWLGAPWKVLAAALAAGSALFMWVFPAHDPLRFAVGTFRLRHPLAYSYAGPSAFYRGFYKGRSVLAYRDEPGGTFAVVENPQPALALAEQFPDLVRSVLGDDPTQLATEPPPRSVVVNGKSDSSTFYDRETLKLAAHLPALFAAHRERVMIVGLGTGVTAGEFTLYPDVRSIEVAEISRAVVEFLPYFSASNHHVADDRRLAIHNGDGFRVLRRSSARWNIVTSEPSNPWMTGVDTMFSREFYRLVREHLAPDGVFLQWMQRYATNERIAAMVVNTLRSEFPHVRVFRTEGTDDLLLASTTPLGDEAFERAEALLLENPALAESLAPIGVHGAAELREREHPEVLAEAAELSRYGIETLDRPRIHYLAGWAFFSGQSLDDAAGAAAFLY